MNYKKGIFVLSLVILFNLALTFSFAAGAMYFADKTYTNGKKIVEESKEKGFFVFTKFSKKLFDKTDDLRKEDPFIVESQNLFDVIDYDLNISFDMTGKKIDGICYMHANSISDTLGTIYINFYDNMNVSDVYFTKIRNNNLPYDAFAYDKELIPADYSRGNNYIIIKANQNLSRNEEFIIKISYSGTPVSIGFDSFSFKDIYNKRIAYSLSEPNYAPVWWPCKDLPDDKILTTTRFTVPTGYKAVSNGLLKDSTMNENGTSTFIWKNSYPISTYLVSVVAAEFSYWEDTYTSIDETKTMPVVYYMFQRDSAKSVVDWKITPEMIKCFSKTWGEYPFIDEKYGMAQFGWTSGAMEHQTLTSMGYLLLTGDGRYEDVISHELAHQWFGDAITLETWGDIWLNEGFASYCEAIWKEYKKGKQGYLDHMQSFDYGYFSGTVYAPKGFIDDPGTYPTVYQKGAWVLHMLRGVVGDEIFFKALRDYFEKYKYKNANTKQFIAVVEDNYGQNLDWFFDGWLFKGTGRPKYEFSWKYNEFEGQNNSGAYTVRLQIKQVQTDWDVYKMPVKIRISTEAGDKEFTVFNDLKDQSFTLTVDSKPKELKLDPDGWILKKIVKAKYN